MCLHKPYFRYSLLFNFFHSLIWYIHHFHLPREYTKAQKSNRTQMTQLVIHVVLK